MPAKSSDTNLNSQNLASGKHNPAMHNDIEAKVFHVFSSSLARPSILLGASIGGFTGSISLYWLAKYFGFNYSASSSLIWLLAGAGIGLLIEIVVSGFRKNSK